MLYTLAFRFLSSKFLIFLPRYLEPFSFYSFLCPSLGAAGPRISFLQLAFDASVLSISCSPETASQLSPSLLPSNMTQVFPQTDLAIVTFVFHLSFCLFVSVSLFTEFSFFLGLSGSICRLV